MAKGRYTGGRKKGSKNKPKVEILPKETAKAIVAETARAVVLTSAPVRTPKAVMLDAMIRFESLGMEFLARAERLAQRNAGLDRVTAEAMEGHKFIVAAVECATKVAPYIHARLLAVESRGDMTEDKAPYVVRVPAVLADSSAWQTAVGALADQMAAQSPSGGRPEALPHPAQSQPEAEPPAPAPTAVPLAMEPKTGRITAMPPRGSVAIKPAGSEEWLAQVTEQRRKASG